MRQHLLRTRYDRAAYEYSVQPTEDRHEERLTESDAPRRGRWQSKGTPNYKPAPLRWPFISTVIALLLAAMALIVVAEKQMPDSDSNAAILGVHPDAPQPARLLVHAPFDNTSSALGPHVDSELTTQSTSASSSDNSNVATDPPSTTSPILGASSSSLPSGAKIIPISVSVSTFTTNITMTSTTVVETSVFTTVKTIPFTTTSTYTTTIESSFTSTGQTTFRSSGGHGGGKIPISTGIATQVLPTTITSGATTTIGGFSTITVGEVTITFYETVTPTIKPPVPHSPNVVTVTGVEIIDGTTVAVVHAQDPITLAVPADEVRTEVVDQRISTGEIWIEGSAVTDTVVITPAPAVPVEVVTRVGGTPVTLVNSPNPITVITEVDGTQWTIVETPPPRTVVSMEGGVLTTINTLLAPSQVGRPFTYTDVHDVEGTSVTQVVVTAPVGPPFQPVTLTITTNVGGTPTLVTITPGPTTVVETVDGTVVTRVTTPPVTSITTTVGRTRTTQTIVTTPTGIEPISLTFVSTSDGTLSTFTSTIPPTTRLTTISGAVKTVTSTPPPKTSFSTRARSTRTYTSTTTPTATSGSNSPGPTTIVGSTRVFKWTEADIFLGTFLPPLLGVALVIPLRVIDLYAKLYQPFLALARPGGGSGAETLLLQYTGLMALVTPVVTLLQGHPVPFLTTLMVCCASFMAPLATEAIGLKLHGTCYLSTASPTCGPALGVSPAPAHALVGLLGAVIVLLGLVLFFLSRWVTGVCADPWSIAGMASLAGNPQIRIRQNTERAMRRTVAHRRYGLGYFRNAAGRLDYGLILTDKKKKKKKKKKRTTAEKPTTCSTPHSPPPPKDPPPRAVPTSPSSPSAVPGS
ncbi:hypothetical protein VTK26DRAFT_2681 [Humicola hyalothermophila]